MQNRQKTYLTIIILGVIAIAYLSISIYRQAQQLFPELSDYGAVAGFTASSTSSATPVAAVADTSAYSAGQTLFAQNCTACHGARGEGSSIAPALNAPEVRQMDSETLQNIVTFGRPGTAMPAWGTKAGGTLSAEEIGELVSLIRAGAWAPSAPYAVTDENFSGISPQAVTLYSQNCAVCHGATGDGTGMAPPLNSPSLRARMTTDALASTIRNGRPGTRMPAWGAYSAKTTSPRWRPSSAIGTA